MKPTSKRVTDLKPGDACDLEGDSYADPESNVEYFTYEYPNVVSVTREMGHVLVKFDVIEVRFPENHWINFINPENLPVPLDSMFPPVAAYA